MVDVARLTHARTMSIQSTHHQHQPGQTTPPLPGPGAPPPLRTFKPPEGHKKRPVVLRKLTERVRRYLNNPAVLPTLNNANASTRQQRSERREACILMLSGAIHFLELSSMRVGVPQEDGTMRGVTMQRLADMTGLGLRRAERAIADLKAAGLIEVHRICEQLPSGEYIGRAAIRTIPKSLFGLFRLGRELSKARDRATQRLRKKRNGEPMQAQADLTRRSAVARGLVDKLKNAARAKLRKGDPKLSERELEEQASALVDAPVPKPP